MRQRKDNEKFVDTERKKITKMTFGPEETHDHVIEKKRAKQDTMKTGLEAQMIEKADMKHLGATQKRNEDKKQLLLIKNVIETKKQQYIQQRHEDKAEMRNALADQMTRKKVVKDLHSVSKKIM